MNISHTIDVGFNGRFFPETWRPALQEIAFAKTHGFTAIQFQGKPEGLAPGHLGGEFEAIRDALQQAKVLAVMEIVVRMDADGRTESGRTPLEILMANLPAITALPCRYVHWHVVPFEPLDEVEGRRLEEQLLPELSAAVALAQEQHIRFGFEHNEPSIGLFSTPEACTRALEFVPKLGFVWDFNHTIPEHRSGFQSLISRMSMVHVSDTPLPEVNYHLPLGMGKVDFDGYCRALISSGFSGPAILEVGGLPKSGGYGRDTDEVLIDSMRRLTQAFPLGTC